MSDLGSSTALPTPVLPGRSAQGTAPNIRLIALLSIGHLVVDITQGGLPAILPFLKTSLALSYTAVGALVLVANLTSSVIQPLFGFLADRQQRRWILPVSVLLAASGMSMIGVATSYRVVLLLLIVMGAGVASFHPEAYRTAASVAGARRATAISWFSVGGNAGTALGPPLMAALIAAFGLWGSIGLLAPGLAMATLFLWILPSLSAPGKDVARCESASHEKRGRYGAILLLMLVVALRSWAQLGFTTFLPFYYVDFLKADPHSVGIPLFIFLGMGAIGTLIGGPLADRWGAHKFMQWAFLVAAPFGVLFLLTNGALALMFLGIFGGVLVSTFTISVVLGQSYLPGNAGLASGLIVGFAIGTGGVAVTLLGWVADHYGLLAVLWIAALTPLACFVATAFLPRARD